MTQPASAIQRGPKRSTNAPATGWVKPHTMFCTAIAMAKSAAAIPRFWITGVWNRPSDWRTPMAMLSMIAAPLSMAMACPRVTSPVWNGAGDEAASCAMRWSFGGWQD